MKKRLYTYLHKSKRIRTLVLTILMGGICSPVIVLSMAMTIPFIDVLPLFLITTVVLRKYTNKSDILDSLDGLRAQLREQRKDQKQRFNDFITQVAQGTTAKEIVDDIQESLPAAPSRVPVVAQETTVAAPQWDLVYKHNQIFADAMNRDYTYSMKQALFTAARRAADAVGVPQPLLVVAQLIAWEQEHERQRHEVARQQELEHQVKLAEDVAYAQKYKLKKEVAVALLEQLVHGSQADQLSMTRELFYRYQNDLVGYDRAALNAVLNELKSVYVGSNGLPCEQVSSEKKNLAGKKFEQFKLRLARSPKEQIYICPEKFHVSRDDAVAGFVLSFIDLCEKEKPEKAFDWLQILSKPDQKLTPFEQVKKESILNHQSLFNTIYTTYQNEWGKIYTGDGFVKVGKEDPRLTSLSKSRRAKISARTREREDFNGILLLRHERLKNLQHLLGIRTQKQADTCAKILYGIIDREMVHAPTIDIIDYLVDEVTPETLPIFFNARGICKLHAEHPAASGTRELCSVDTPLKRELLKRINYLAALDAQQLHQPSINRLQDALQKAAHETHEPHARVHLKYFDEVFPYVASPGLGHVQLEQKFAEAEQNRTVHPKIDSQDTTNGELRKQAAEAADQAPNPAPVLFQEAHNQQQKIPDVSPGGSSGGKEPENKEKENDAPQSVQQVSSNIKTPAQKPSENASRTVQTPYEKPKILGRGSTGRTEPCNLDEQLAMEEVKSNPKGEELDKIKMTDPRWPAEEGWVKMSQMVDKSDGTKVEIHYVENKLQNVFDDFKFKDNPKL